MKASIPTTEERFRRHQRDLRAYRQRSLWRRSQARFYRDLSVHPRLFLAPGKVQAGTLLRSWEDAVEALRGQVVWTLDTAGRLASGVGFLTTRDLTGYMSRETLGRAVSDLLVEPTRSSSIGVAPVLDRPALLIAHLDTEPPPFFVLDSGDQVVTWESLMQDLKGTLGWRPDLLTRLEQAYRHRQDASGNGVAAADRIEPA